MKVTAGINNCICQQVSQSKNLHFLGGKAWDYMRSLMKEIAVRMGWRENTDLRGSQPMFGGFDSAFLQSRMALNFALCFEFELLWIMTGCVLGVYIETSTLTNPGKDCNWRILFWGSDWNLQSSSREGIGFLGYNRESTIFHLVLWRKTMLMTHVRSPHQLLKANSI